MRKYLILLLTVLLLAACKTQPQSEHGFAEPKFEIVSIIIIQADLINTQFETVLKIDNPNNFDIQVSSIKYELYGNGLFWADGTENDILNISANSSKETKFRFSMNFINMNRKLLDDVIAMRQIQYRFKGEAQVQMKISRASPFVMKYDISGLSGVKAKAD